MAPKCKFSDAQQRLDELPARKLLMVGTPAEQKFIDWALDVENTDLLDDLDYNYSANTSEQAIDEDFGARNTRKLAEIMQKNASSFVVLHALRPGKKLLVLDLDLTLFDMKSTAPTYAMLKRPHTDEFLTQCYQEYDLCVWSQTSWRWLEVKLTELGLLTNPAYRLAFVLDKTWMFQIKTAQRKHAVKPLELIWRLLPQHSAETTVHVDDLARNFALNPQCGLKIPPFKDYRSQQDDRVLLQIARYLLAIARLPSFTALDHTAWTRM